MSSFNTLYSIELVQMETKEVNVLKLKIRFLLYTMPRNYPHCKEYQVILVTHK